MPNEKSSRLGMMSALAVGGVIHSLIASAVFVTEPPSAINGVLVVIAWGFLSSWSLPAMTRAPGPVRAAMVLAPSTAVLFAPNRELGVSAALALSALIIVAWRGALEIVQLRASEWWSLAIASAVGGPMLAVLFSPRLDRRVTELVRSSSLSSLVGSTFDDRRLELVFADGLDFLAKGTNRFDAIIVDFPDPNTPGLAALFARQTWQLVAKRLAPDGLVGLQASSPRFPFVVGSIVQSLEAAGLSTLAYTRVIESLGANAFVLGAARPIDRDAFVLHAPAATLETDGALRDLLAPLATTEGEVLSVNDREGLVRLARARARHR